MREAAYLGVAVLGTAVLGTAVLQPPHRTLNKALGCAPTYPTRPRSAHSAGDVRKLYCKWRASLGADVGRVVAHARRGPAWCKQRVACCRSRALTIPLVAAHIGLSPGADMDQYRRSPSPVPAQM